MKKNKFVLLIFGALCLAMVNFSWTSGSKPAAAEAQPTELTGEELVARGEYLVTIMGCNDCHSPKRMGANGPELIPELLCQAPRETAQYSI